MATETNAQFFASLRSDLADSLRANDFGTCMRKVTVVMHMTMTILTSVFWQVYVHGLRCNQMFEVTASVLWQAMDCVENLAQNTCAP